MISQRGGLLALLVLMLLMPVLDQALPRGAGIARDLVDLMPYALFGLGLHVVTGLSGQLNLGAAAFMAVGAYAYAILTSPIYPFQIGFWPGCLGALGAAGVAGLLVSLPTMRLRGDYLAIVTLACGEIAQDLLRNLEAITLGTKSITPVPGPGLPGMPFASGSWIGTYYLFLAITLGVAGVLRNIERSPIGRAWLAIREDELAAASMGINVPSAKIAAFATGAAICGLSGALYASWIRMSGDPATYDFQRSVEGLCIVILGGLGSIEGVLVGTLIVVGFNGIILDRISGLLGQTSWGSSDLVLANPANWKFLLFGLTLILMVRLRPAGLLPAGRSARNRPPRGPAAAAGPP